MDVITIGNDHVFAYLRTHGDERIVILANFSEHEQAIKANELRLYGLSYQFTDLISGKPVRLLSDDLRLEPYQVMWLAV